MKKLLFLVGISLITVFSIPASGHVGDQVYPIYEIPTESLPDLHDGSLDDWRTIFPTPTLTEKDFISHPEVGEGSIIGAPDLAVNVYLGWYKPSNQLYVAVERWDDVYSNFFGGAYPGLGRWGSDYVEIMVDGDHSGGLYYFDLHAFETEDVHWRDMIQRQAQQYFATAWSEDQKLLYYNGADLPQAQWVVQPPFADAQGMIQNGAVHYSAIEFSLTPFDILRWESPSESAVSPLYTGKVIGINVALLDFDSSIDNPGLLHGYHTLSSERLTYTDASTFVDGILVGFPPATSMQVDSWARIKASFR